jgi:hypothetical protein
LEVAKNLDLTLVTRSHVGQGSVPDPVDVIAPVIVDVHVNGTAPVVVAVIVDVDVDGIERRRSQGLPSP